MQWLDVNMSNVLLQIFVWLYIYLWFLGNFGWDREDYFYVENRDIKAIFHKQISVTLFLLKFALNFKLYLIKQM